MTTIRLWVPATFWDDHTDRNPVDPGQSVATEIRHAGNRFLIEADPSQLEVLRSDAVFYAGGNVDDCDALVRSAQATVRAIEKATA